MAGRPAEAKLPKPYSTRGLLFNLPLTPVGGVETDADNTMDADPAPDDQPTAGVGNTTGEQHPTAEGVATPAKKHTKLSTYRIILMPDSVM